MPGLTIAGLTMARLKIARQTTQERFLLRVQSSCAFQEFLITNGRYTPEWEALTLKQSEPILATPP